MTRSHLEDLSKQAILLACDELRAIKDPFNLGRHDYASVGSYLENLAAKVAKSKAEEITVVELLDWGASYEQTALCDAIRIVLTIAAKTAARGKPQRHEKLTIAEGEVRVISGDLEIAGDVKSAGTLLVDGDLVVGGVLRALGDDWTSGTLYVSGGARVRGCYLMGPVMIVGDLVAAKAVCGHYFDDGGALWVGGRLDAPLYVGLGDRKDVVRKAVTRRLHGRALRRAFPAHFDEDGVKDEEQFLEAIGVG